MRLSDFDRWLTEQPEPMDPPEGWVDPGPEPDRCEPCALGNHTGTNGTPGCHGGACSCDCEGAR